MNAECAERTVLPGICCFTPADNALNQSWQTEGIAYNNFPYSNPSPWVEKAVEQQQAGQFVMQLAPVGRPSTQWWQTWVKPHAEVYDVPFRVPFLNWDGSTPDHGPEFDCAVLVYRPAAPLERVPVTEDASITVITTEDQLTQALPVLLAQPILGLDVETARAVDDGGPKRSTALDPHRGRLRLIQLATPDHTFVIDCFQVSPAPLAPLFTSAIELAGHNLNFDLSFLVAVGLPAPSRCFDTMLAAQLLEARADRHPAGHFDLASVTQRYLGEVVEKDEQQSDWSAPQLTPAQLAYAARDAQVALRLRDHLEPALHAAGLDRIAAIEFTALPAIAALQTNGCPFDLDGWRALAATAEAERDRLGGELETMLATELPDDPDVAPVALTVGKRGQTLKPKARAAVWRSPTRLVGLLHRRGHTTLTSTKADALIEPAITDPFVARLLDYRIVNTQLENFGSAWTGGAYDDRTGRLYTRFLQLGSEAGRMSCREPNIQQIPRLPAYRACVRAPAGRALVKADYSQIELRIAAHLSQDPLMLTAFQNGDDLHNLTAASVLDVAADCVPPEQRQLAKALNFGLIYGIGAPRLQQHISGFGIRVSVADAAALKQRFFATYRGLKAWQERHGSRHGETRTLWGRRRLNMTKFNDRLNTPMQGAGADLLKLAIGQIWGDRAAYPSAVVVNVVHDEIVMECDAEEAAAVAAWLTGHMEAAGAELLPDVPVVAAAEIMADWSGTPVLVAEA